MYKPVELEGKEYNVETDTIRVFVSLYLKSPYISNETFYLPEKTVNYLIGNDKLTGEEKEYWLAHTFKLEYLENDNLSASETSERIEGGQLRKKLNKRLRKWLEIKLQRH